MGSPLKEDIVLEVANASTETKVSENYEILVSYVYKGKSLDRENTEIDDVYAYSMACDIIKNFNLKLQMVKLCRQ